MSELYSMLKAKKTGVSSGGGGGATVNNATITIQKNGTTVDSFTSNQATDKTINITVPTSAADVSALPTTTKYASALRLTINSSTFVVTGQLIDQDGNDLGTAQTIDLPLESVVVNGSYNSQTKKVVLTLQNGNTIEFSVADLVSGLQTELSASNKLNPAYINYDSTHRAVSDTEKSTWNSKQNAIDSSHKLSADLVDDTNATNKFATAEELEQIQTNKNNISTANAELVKLVDSGAKNVLEMYSYEVGSMNADVDNSKTYRVRVHGTGQNVAITYGKLKSFESGNYVVKINIVSGTLTSLYLNDGTDNISITDATSGYNITLDSSKTYQLRTYAGNGATIDFTVDIMVCSKSAWDISQKITEYLPTYAEIAKPIDGDITWNTTALGSEPNINSKYIMQQGNIVNIHLYIEFTTALTEDAETIIGVLTGVAFPKSIYRGVAMQCADYYSSAFTSCYIAIGKNGNVVIKPPTGATNKRYLINITYHNH